jgi:flagellar hook protein FlgE
VSLTDTLYIGSSGLDAMSTALGIVGNNVSNASTVGFKSDTAQFSDILGGELGSQPLGAGVSVGQQQEFTQGSIEQTGNPLDVAISGNGFFVVNGSFDGSTQNYYTRDGQFQLNSSGGLVDSNNLAVQGYAINASGQRSAAIGDLQLGGLTDPATATTTAGMQLNLDSATTTNGPFNPANPSGTSDFQTSETVYDSLGGAHEVDVYFDKNAAGQWDYHAMVDGGQLQGGTAGTPTQIASGTLTFGTNGALTNQTATSSSASFVGATPNQAINFDFTGATQDDAPSATGTVDVDGNAAGSLTGITIGTDGTVSAQFDNGQSTTVAQLATATFQNDNGLANQGSGLWAQGAQSGEPAIGAPGAGGRGSVTQGSLEQSNVDLSSQLVTMIQYQQAFDASSKTVTTASEMLQTVNQMTT